MSINGSQATLPPKLRAPSAAIALLYAIGRPELASRLGKRVGDAAVVKVPGFGPTVVVSSPELAKQIFQAPPGVLTSGESSPLARTLGRHSIFALDGERHLSERRLLLPPFHGQRMKDYERIFEEEAVAALAEWPTNEDFPTLEPFMQITLNAILRAVFGAQDDEFDELRDVIPPLVKLGSILTAVTPLQKDFAKWSPWARFMRLRGRYNAVVDRLIDQGKGDPALAERSDVLALLLQARYEDGEPMTREQISDELLTILVAGHETTAGMLAWAVERLRRHPHVLAELVDEAARGEGALREATIWELQRVRPVIVAVERRVAKEFELGEWRVPPRMSVAVDALGIHNDPQVYPNPQVFDPSRFLDAKPDTYGWVPFGGGVRRCIGTAFAKLEMDVVLRILLTRCEWVTTDAKPERWRFRGVAFVPAKGGAARFSKIDASALAPEGSAAPALVA